MTSATYDLTVEYVPESDDPITLTVGPVELRMTVEHARQLLVALQQAVKAATCS